MGIGAVILESAMVASKLLFQADYRLISAGISIGRFALGIKRDLGIKVNLAFGPEPDSIPGQGYMAGIAAIKILIGHFSDPVADAIAQSFAEIKISVDQRHHTVADFATFARGSVFGSPVFGQIQARGGVPPATIQDAVAAAMRREFGGEPGVVPMQAIVFEARKP